MTTTTQTKKSQGQDADLQSRIRHLDNCPAERLESFDATGPRKNQAGAIIGTKTYRVARCVDCGEQVQEPIKSEED